ncbi:GntR family transcriptional regulator [uncultured Ferrovibrio sp.]|jgi:DNA-binding GntR family transcriptional regulator|uniref:GntR family transcriptional regulator n=1 Tax=uncultured Ferrovibrio sp. TaxID=1576913 RepID=UPI0026325EC5|nr:GntR family transcriptional regulator [uncultured Ferrovibrio sp.]
MNQVRLQAETKIAAKRTRADTLRQRIADEILVGKLPPGTRLEEQDLADRFGVSRTPVREALKALVETGLVDIRPHRGAVVATPSRQHMRDLFEVMRELEAICARYAAQRMTSAERKKLADLHEQSRQMVRDGEVEAYAALNVAFHSCIFEGTHNTALVENSTAVRRRLSPFRRAQFRLVGRLASSFAEHESVVNAILRGDAIAAEQAMARHISAADITIEEFTR